MQDSTKSVEGSFVEEKSAALVWHYRPAQDQALAIKQAGVLIKKLQKAAQQHKLSILSGSRAVEVKPSAIHKGAAAQALLNGHAWDFILAAGDDVTDEDLFKAMPPTAVTVKIGSGNTTAKVTLPNPGVFLQLLQTLAG